MKPKSRAKKLKPILAIALSIATVITVVLCLVQQTVAMPGYVELTGSLTFGATTVNGSAGRTLVKNHSYIVAVYGTGGWSSNGSYQFNGVDYRAAFDSSKGDGVGGASYFDGTKTGYAGVEFKTPQYVTQIGYQARAGQTLTRLNGAYFQGSNDGVNYTTLFTFSDSSTSAFTYKKAADGLDTSTAYRYFRVAGHNGLPDVLNIQEHQAPPANRNPSKAANSR